MFELCVTKHWCSKSLNICKRVSFDKNGTFCWWVSWNLYGWVGRGQPKSDWAAQWAIVDFSPFLRHKNAKNAPTFACFNKYARVLAYIWYMLLWWVGTDKKLNAINGGDKRWRDKKQSMEEGGGRGGNRCATEHLANHPQWMRWMKYLRSAWHVVCKGNHRQWMWWIKYLRSAWHGWVTSLQGQLSSIGSGCDE